MGQLIISPAFIWWGTILSLMVCALGFLLTASLFMIFWNRLEDVRKYVDFVRLEAAENDLEVQRNVRRNGVRDGAESYQA